jgi:hypothetical protein
VATQAAGRLFGGLAGSRVPFKGLFSDIEEA